MTSPSAKAFIASPPVEVVLLAAGASRRMGEADKLMLPAPSGEPLLRQAARLYLALGLTITVVLPIDRPERAAALSGLAVGSVTAPPPCISADDDGQQQSLLAGLAAMPLVAPGVLVALADMPWLTGDDIAALVAHFAALGASRILIPRHQGQRGNPVIFPVAVLRAMLGDPASITPRAFISTHPEQIAWHEAAHDRFLRDIDTPADAATLFTHGVTNP